MASNDQYQQRDFWTQLNKRLNEEQESVCIEANEKGECLVSARYIILDLSETPKEKEHVNKNV